MTNTKNVLRFIIIFQYIPRLFLMFPLSSQIVKATGVVTETAWAGAAYNLMLYMLASHVSRDKDFLESPMMWPLFMTCVFSLPDFRCFLVSSVYREARSLLETCL